MRGIFVLYLLVAFIYAALCPPAQIVYDFSFARAVVTAASSSVSLWLLYKRRHVARRWALATVVLCVVLSAADLFGLGSINKVASMVSLPIAGGVTAFEWFGAGLVSATGPRCSSAS